MTSTLFDRRRAAPPVRALPAAAPGGVAQLFRLDRLSTVPRRLVCRWHRAPDGRLIGVWEPEIGPGADLET